MRWFLQLGALHLYTTGGARGIGLMIAAGFVANGAKVYIASRSKDACEAAAKQLSVGRCRFTSA